MKRTLNVLGFAFALVVFLGSNVLAQTSGDTSLTNTLLGDNDEDDATGSAVVFRLPGHKGVGIEVQNLRPDQTYGVYNNNGASPCSDGLVGTLLTNSVGDAVGAFILPGIAQSFVHVCRDGIQILTGQVQRGNAPF